MISVCMATYNGERYLREQLNSILPQLTPEDEIIISDDNSTDHTRDIIHDIIHSYATSHIRLLQGPCLKSAPLNFEHALKHAQGDIILLCDQDDVWEPHKVITMQDALKHSACIVSDCYVTDAHLNLTAESFYAHNHTITTSRLKNIIGRNGYLGCCMAFRRELLPLILPFPSCVPMHDIWIGNVAAFTLGIQFIPDRLIRFRRHKQTTSASAHNSPYSLWRKISFRLQLLPLIPRIMGYKWKNIAKHKKI